MAHRASVLFVDKHSKDARYWLRFRSHFQRLKPLRQVYGCVQAYFRTTSSFGSVANFSLLLRYCRFGADNWVR